MSFKETVARVYRETFEAYGGRPVPRAEIIESATATLLVEVRAGRLHIDRERAIRAALVNADEADGRAADRILARMAHGEVPITVEDLDVVVTLGGGMRKRWADVTAEDLESMRDARQRNYRSVRDAWQVFAADVMAVRPVLTEFGTVAAAFAAGGFPPNPSNEKAAA